MRFDRDLAKLEKIDKQQGQSGSLQAIVNAYAARMGQEPAKVKNANLAKAIIKAYKLKKAELKRRAKEKKKAGGTDAQPELTAAAVTALKISEVANE